MIFLILLTHCYILTILITSSAEEDHNIDSQGSHKHCPLLLLLLVNNSICGKCLLFCK